MATDRSPAILAVGIALTLLAAAAPSFLARNSAISGNVRNPAYAEKSTLPGDTLRTAPPLPPPQTIAALFGWKAPVVPVEVPVARKEERGADWIRPLGEIETEDRLRYLFFKDQRTGRVFRVRLDGTPEGDSALLGSNPDAYRIRCGEDIYIVPRRPR